MKRTIVLFSLAMCTVALGGRSKQTVEPDYRRGEVLEGEINYCNLGPIGAVGNMWANRDIGTSEQTRDTRMIQVRSVAENTPADGVLAAGDVIMGIGGETFSSDARKALSAAITKAEAGENGGELTLTVWRPGTTDTDEVTLTLPVMGSYSATSPWACEKTAAIVDAACQDILQRGFFEERRNKAPSPKAGIPTLLSALGLLATGEDKYLPVVQKYARAIGDPDVSLDIEKSSSWSWSYKTLLLTEYYLATKDDYVLPAIKEYATKIAMGRSGVGTWSHGMAIPSQNGGQLYGYASAYGAMNQCSLTCTISLILARKCGIQSEEIDKAIALSTQFYRWYVDKGTIPYGDHAPSKAYDNNGVNSQAAVMFDLVRDPEATDYYARMTLGSFRQRQSGHTGHFFSYQWGALGAARGGKDAAQSFIRNTRWFTELERQANGGSHYQPQLASIDHGKYRNWRTTGSRLMQHCLPRKQLYITGKGGSCIAPISGASLVEAVDAARFAPEAMGTKALLKALSSRSPVVRRLAATELGRRDDNVVAELSAMLDSPDRYARYGASEGLSYAGRGSEAAVDALLKILENDADISMRYYAASAFRKKRHWERDTRSWEVFDNMLAKSGGAIEKAIPALMTLAANHDPVLDPGRKLPKELVETLLYGGSIAHYTGLFPNGEGIETVDRSLLIPFIKALLQNPNGGGRSRVSILFDRLKEQDLNALWGDIYYATKYQAPSGVMFSGGVRNNGLALMAEHGVQEAISVGIDYALRQEGWGNKSRKQGGIPPLLSYGHALEDYVPEIDEVLAGWGGNKTGSKNNPEDAENFRKRLADALKKPAPELKSIRPFIDRTPDPVVSSLTQ